MSYTQAPCPLHAWQLHELHASPLPPPHMQQALITQHTPPHTHSQAQPQTHLEQPSCAGPPVVAAHGVYCGYSGAGGGAELAGGCCAGLLGVPGSEAASALTWAPTSWRHAWGGRLAGCAASAASAVACAGQPLAPWSIICWQPGRPLPPTTTLHIALRLPLQLEATSHHTSH